MGLTGLLRKNGLLLRLEMSPKAGLVVSAVDRVLISSFWFSESTQAMDGVTCRGLSLFLFFSQRDKNLTIPSYERGVARLLRYDRHP
ncbi:hypothetical protein [Aeromonas salmonicida]|uniref:hypothetical protein n=1 Tax=Aeromonas salmonicida TaxID=645 RepID=UPI001F51A0E5|nr:hypothetical protein [Aeromonas salmonicida]